MKKYLYEDLYNLEEKHWWHISKRRIVQFLIKKYAKKNPRILDVGCGTGKNTEELKKYGEIWGIDNSKEAIKFCRKRGLDNIKQGDAENTHLPPNSFDVITLLDVLEHTEESETLTEMKRILKKDGLLIITVPAFPWLWSKWDEVLHHKRRYTIQSLSKTLKSHNLSLVYATYIYSFLVLPAFIVRKVKELISPNYYPSDFKLSNPLINFLMGFISTIEFWISQKVPLKIGTSVVAVIKK